MAFQTAATPQVAPPPPQQKPKIRFENPETKNLTKHIKANAKLGLPMVLKGCHSDARGVVICGLGHSLTTPGVLRKIRAAQKKGWLIFGIKEAITFLIKKGIKVDYSVAMDPKPDQVAKTPIHKDVIYCMASSCHPVLYKHLMDNDCEIRIFHSACGATDEFMAPGFVLDLTPTQTCIFASQIEMRTDDGLDFSPVCTAQRDEVGMYHELFGDGTTVQGGFTVANRALGLAELMGIHPIVLAGCDFGWRDGRSYYPSYSNGKPLDNVFLNDHGKIDGKNWHARADMVASAVEVAKLVQDGRVKVWGDSLAASCAKWPRDKLVEICTIT